MSDPSGGNTPALLEGFGTVLAGLAAVWVAFVGSLKRHRPDPDVGDVIQEQALRIAQLEDFIRSHGVIPPARREP